MPGQVLSETVVKIAADALLLSRSRDLDNLALQLLALGDVVQNGEPVLRSIHLQRSYNAGRHETCTVLARALEFHRNGFAGLGAVAQSARQTSALHGEHAEQRLD